MKFRTLNMLQKGENGRVLSVTHRNKGMHRRLLDIGVIPGTTIFCITKAPGGDPSLYLICDAMIALRDVDAKYILLEG